LYRVVGLVASERGIALDADPALERLLDDLRLAFDADRILVDGRDVSIAIRRREVGELASQVSARPIVRTRLVALQRSLARPPGIVMEGRDIGTVVFPDAPVKFYLTATPAERAHRRMLELAAKGESVDEAALAAELAMRDTRDSTRPVAPLRPADDAIVIDTTGQTLAAVVSEMERRVREHTG
jgi:cytidylate kinase